MQRGYRGYRSVLNICLTVLLAGCSGRMSLKHTATLNSVYPTVGAVSDVHFTDDRPSKEKSRDIQIYDKESNVETYFNGVVKDELVKSQLLKDGPKGDYKLTGTLHTMKVTAVAPFLVVGVFIWPELLIDPTFTEATVEFDFELSKGGQKVFNDSVKTLNDGAYFSLYNGVKTQMRKLSQRLDGAVTEATSKMLEKINTRLAGDKGTPAQPLKDSAPTAPSTTQK